MDGGEGAEAEEKMGVNGTEAGIGLSFGSSSWKPDLVRLRVGNARSGGTLSNDGRGSSEQFRRALLAVLATHWLDHLKPGLATSPQTLLSQDCALSALPSY